MDECLPPQDQQKLIATAILYYHLDNVDSATIVSDQQLARIHREFKSGHLARAINIPYDEIGSRIRSVTDDKNREIVLYCRSGRRSGIALRTLKEMGYTKLENAGGYEQFRKRLGE